MEDERWKRNNGSGKMEENQWKKEEDILVKRRKMTEEEILWKRSVSRETIDE